MKLKTKLILFLAVASLLPLVTLALVGFLSAQASMSRLISDELVSTVEAESKQLESRLAGAFNDLISWSQQPVFQDLLTDDAGGDLHETLLRLHQQYPQFRSLSTVNEAGIVVASSDENYMGVDWSDNPLFHQNKVGKPFQGPVSGDSPLVLPMSIAVRADYDAEVIIGGLVGELDWRLIQQWLSSITLAGSSQDVAHRLILTVSDSHRVLYDSLAPADIDAAFAPPQQTGISGLQYQGRDYLVGSSQTVGQGAFENPRWTLHALIDEAVAFSSVNQLRSNFLRIVAVTLLVVALACGYFLYGLRRPFNQLKLAIVELGNDSQQLKANSRALADGSLRQQGDTAKVAASIEEMAAAIRQVAEHAGEASSVGDLARARSHEGNQLAENSLSSFLSLAEDIRQAAETSRDFSVSAERISKIIDVIDGISYKTNILAINAAIEASRAGEQGRGFSVVASEVRKLASSTQTSTEEVKRIIQQLQTGAADLDRAMQRSHRRTETSLDQIGQVSTKLELIRSSVDEVTELNGAIAAADQQQAVCADEIGKSILNIQVETDKSVQQALDNDHMSQRLSALNDKLQDLVRTLG